MKPSIEAQEDKVNLSKEEARQVRRRSVSLLADILAPVRLHLLFAVVLVVLSMVLKTAMPWIISEALNTTINPLMAGDAGPATRMVLLYAGAGVLSAICIYTNILLTYKISQSALYDLRQRMFDHSQKLSVGFHETYTSGRVTSRLTSDLDTIRQFLDSGLSELASMLLGIIFTVVALFLMDWRAGVALAIAFVPVWLLTIWFRSASSLTYRAQRVASARIISRFAETFTGIRAVKAFRAEPQVRRDYAAAAEDYRARVMESVKVHGLYMPTLQALGNTFVAAVLVIGGYAVLGGSMQVGTLLALVIYANRVFEPIDRKSVV